MNNKTEPPQSTKQDSVYSILHITLYL